MKIVLDIETIKPSKKDWAFIKGLSADDYLEDDLATNREYEKSVFDATHARIVCIGLLILKADGSADKAMTLVGSDEKGLLEHFWKTLASVQPELIITHNGVGFDLPFIKKRSIINQVKPSIDLNLARFRNKPIFDTMAEWSNWDSRSYTKLDILARALGVETKSGSGEQVAPMWESGEWDAIADYCLQDVYVTYACYCRMTFQEPRASREVLINRERLNVNLEETCQS